MPKILESITTFEDKVVLRLTFGGGLASAINAAEIDVRESSSGQNDILDVDEIKFRPRPSFDLAGTAPNGEAINGFVELIKSDGSVTVLVQAGSTVYDWDGGSTFTSVGTVPTGSKLRGGRFSTSILDDIVIITDLEKKTVVKQWDGTTFSDFSHNLGGDLFAKYAIIEDERLDLANVKSGSTDTPHVLLASKRGTTFSASDFGTLSTSVRASESGAGTDDAFYIPMPDMRAINGLMSLFGVQVLSTNEGQIWKLEGNDQTDFKMNSLYPGSAAAGDEALVKIGEDALYGRPGIIESLLASEKFGDVEVDDVSRWIADEIAEVKSWTSIYNPRTKRAYFWPENGNEIYVFQKSLYDPVQRVTRSSAFPGGKLGLSPWSKWVTDYGSGDFRQTAAEVIRRVTDKKDVVYFGDASGRILNLEGTGLQDGGSDDIVTDRTSGTIRLPTGSVFDVKGNIKYRRFAGATVTLTFLFGGKEVFHDTRTICRKTMATCTW
ncbi:hypothetical protein LCGC14_1741000 [marine sediment metagenome]|uniref:Uncharacterized protein n=1 Tax=marine sediment metagenome TaxID=412755 RepID=A0A0F9HUA1_9ZZZZ